MNLLEYLIFEFVTTQYNGIVAIKFEAGIPVLIRRTQTFTRDEIKDSATQGSNDSYRD